jgi:protocatechuate 3,4-dioxygenase beta subunit
MRAITLLAALALSTAALGEDAHFVRMWTEAQKQKPARLENAARIAPASEPGQPLVVRGEVRLPDGAPASGVVVFAYQTDKDGIYAPMGNSDPWRLKTWAKTDAAGRFELTTIHPGPYPRMTIPPHIHLSFEATCCGRQLVDLMFEGDPFITPAFKTRFAKAGEHGVYATAKKAGGQENAEVAFTLQKKGDF